ncbi:ee3079a3-c8e9-4dd3-8921-4be62f74142c-CDS [Sclerotinia trifoliorum]|uniref:Ee3079a3-c8e9-4dd3-8921-4be62f74142c-CDS n=1 Tax=Sclerotinia trifoliorum TaxID=28548 RepID=A0A8H2ZV04_9HELO|nr:ee3079a3-c8e9-4dd3-8921-4be62f74142c-CDS [Sclerotinia trifoliorum]
MKYTTAILSGLMAATAVAQPHLRHQHVARHEKRDIAWVTEIEMVTETVDYTTTVWVSAGQLPAPSTSAPSVTPTTLATIPKSSAAASTSVPKSTAAASTSISKSTAAASSSTRAVLDQKPSSSSSSFVAPSSSTFVSVAAPSTTHTSAVVLPTTSSIAPVVIPTTSRVAPVVIPTTSSVAPIVKPTTSSVAPVIPTTSSVAPVVIPTTSSVAPVVIPSSTAAAPVPATTYASSSSFSGSSSKVCGSGTPCTGDMTYYEAGLGACGITTDGSTFAGVALPVGLMGSLSNSNPYCGKTITIKCNSTGKTAQATVIDKCMGCEGNSIDLTNFVFDQLAEEAVGRTQATWYFND